MHSSLHTARVESVPAPVGFRRWVRILSGAAALVGTAAAAAPRAIDTQRERVRILEGQVVALDASARSAQAQYAASRDRLASVRGRIQTNTRDLATAVTSHATAEQRLATRISSLYRRRQPTILEAVLTAVNITDAVNGWGLLGRVATQDATAVQSIAREEIRVRTLRTRLVADRREARVRFVETKSAFQKVQGVRGERRALLSGARVQLAAFITAEQRRQAAIAAAQVRRVAPTTTPSTPTAPVTPSTPSVPGATTGVAAVLNRIAQCESGGSTTIVSPSGQFRGKYQFDPGTWKKLGGSGSDPAQAPEGEQDRVAAKLYGSSGAAPWPVCGRFAR